jgi:hypothetical protein
MQLDENMRIAARLVEYAEMLEQQGEDGFRSRAYRDASDAIAARETPIREVFEVGGRPALIALPTIGSGIAGAIAEMLSTGEWAQLDRLKGTMSPDRLFRTVPGIGPKLAEVLAGECHLETLEDLETALHSNDPPLPGIGPRRRQALIAQLADRLGRPRLRPGPTLRPPVAMLLDVDRLYRDRAEAGSLRKISPKRFNPEGRAWLPVLHARRDDWHFTVLFSNTAQAHRLQRTDDWVVVFFQKGSGPEGRATVVTETRGPLQGKRVVRGREADCAHYHASAA